MRIGIRAHDMEQAPLEELVANIAKKGFKCTQLALKKAIHDFNVNPEAFSPGMALYIKEIFAQNKVDISVLGCYLNITTPDKAEHVKVMETYKAHIRFASLLGCGMVGTETGAVNAQYIFEEANHSEEALQILIENVKIVVDYAEKMGVIFAIEPVYSHIMSDIDRTYKVLQAVNSPNLQVIFDPVNVIHYGNYQQQDEIIKGAFELFGKDIAAIHAKDFKVEDNRTISVPSGSGGLNSELLLGLVKKQKPHIHVLLEDTKPSNAIATREYLERIYQSIE
ncbi:AP endonuclease [Anaerocolumna cellulosilytica]|uniref:AP endonuclease n=1 Tax=Anaerocolumna cellulosilytica TaxID=433286 RepID=A0A6S6QZC8_9FIRM|nr:sugar phosphate isomerase/epimerase family protein [Anaerocolumna cellulosilytica]MBB5197601.1 sugar phosphate isomerase/epimerase [Anaerocolumna cellulosilytica]BCJ95126.1 AP endonuclease [Anaerocolumna cellulosilytica]